MIVEFCITNFRSIKERQAFSMVAETTKSKRESNTFEVNLASGSSVRILRSVVMYGGNAYGKSNFIRAFGSLRALIFGSGYAAVGEPIYAYSPFLFDIPTQEAPTTFECTFIPDDNIKYKYTVTFDRKSVLAEELSFYRKETEKSVFKRIVDPLQEFDTAKFEKDITKEEGFSFPSRIFKNQAILAKFGREVPHRQLTAIYSYFASWRIWEANNSEYIQRLTNSIITSVIPREKPAFFRRLQRLIKAADTKINGLYLKPADETSTGPTGPTGPTSGRQRAPVIERLFGVHTVFDGGNAAGLYQLPFMEESAGTKVLFALGTLVLDAIENGGCVIFDELDNSLHPIISRFLIQLFNNKKYNPKNAQIIFSSHEPHLMDKDVFRSDQIWFAEKDEKGATDIFSAQDFEGVREDISFEKWYLSGKFGAIPHPSEIDYIFNDAEENTPPEQNNGDRMRGHGGGTDLPSQHQG
jgi:predicted ATPase